MLSVKAHAASKPTPKNRGARDEFSLLQINSVVAVAKKVEARDDGRSPKEHVEPESIVTSETVIQSRDKEHDWADLREQSHIYDYSGERLFFQLPE